MNLNFLNGFLFFKNYVKNRLIYIKLKLFHNLQLFQNSINNIIYLNGNQKLVIEINISNRQYNRFQNDINDGIKRKLPEVKRHEQNESKCH